MHDQNQLDFTDLSHEFLGLLALVQLHLSLQLLIKTTSLFSSTSLQDNNSMLLHKFQRRHHNYSSQVSKTTSQFSSTSLQDDITILPHKPPSHLDEGLPLEVEVCLGGELEALRRGGQLAQHRELEVVLEHLLVVAVRLGIPWLEMISSS